MRLMRSLLWGVPLVLVLVVPWYAWVGWRTNGGWYHSFLWYHNVERALGSGALRSHPWWFYLPRLVIDMMPWSLLFPIVLVGCWRRRREDTDTEAGFGFIWLALIALVLSFAQFKRADYLLPAYPGAALFLGCGLERWWRGWALRPHFALTVRVRWLLGGGVMFLCAYVSGWWVYETRVLAQEEPAREYRSFAEVIRRQAPQPEMVLFFRVECHALAFHLGPPVNTIMEWENIRAWAERPVAHFIVTSPELAQEFPSHLGAARVEAVLTNEELAGGHHEQPLVLLRTRPPS